MQKDIIRFLNDRRRIVAPLTLLLLIPLIIACGEITRARASLPAGTQQVHTVSQHIVSQPTASTLSTFIGTWYNHGGVLKIAAGGNATYDARAYSWCGPGVAKPCDTMQGNLIIDGIHMTIHFNHAQGSTAYGTINTSTQNNQGQSITLTLLHNHTANLRSSGHVPLAQVVCDLQAPPGTCGA